MSHRTSADPHTASLPLPDTGEAFTERDAYALSPVIAKRYTFEQAMATPAIAIALRCTAEAVRRATLNRSRSCHA